MTIMCITWELQLTGPIHCPFKPILSPKFHMGLVQLFNIYIIILQFTTTEDLKMEENGETQDLDRLDEGFDVQARATSRASTFSVFSTLSYMNYGHRPRFTFILISCLAFFMTGMTIGALIVRFFVCNSDQNWVLDNIIDTIIEYLSSMYQAI